MSSISPAATASTLSNVTSATATGGQTRINGLISGLNTDQVIQGLLAIDQERITGIQNQETQTQQVQAVYQAIEAKLLALQGDITSLGKSVNGAFDGRTATSSNTNLVNAAADSTAVPGVYRLQVNNLATAQQVASQGFASATSAITQGTLQIALNNGTATTITVDSSNDTLQGLANAINNAATGVSASIVNDGSSAQPYRLLLTAQATGTSNGFTVASQLGAGNSEAAAPTFDATSLGPVVLGAGFTGTAAPTVNAGAGNYTGTANDTYTFTVLSGGTVGTDNNIQLGYTDSTGAHTGTLTLNSGDVDTPQAVADGIQLQLGAGTLVAGQTFSVQATVPNVQAASDASITLGSGAGALTVTSATNQVANLIHGVTLQLNGADSSQPVTITVGNDTATAQKAVDTFVSDYNALLQFIGQQSQFDPTTNQGGLLLGDTRASAIESQIQAVVESAIPGINPQLNQLANLGITTDQSGQLVVDDNKLSSVLAGNVPGVSIGDVKNLFALTGSASSPGVQFVTGSARTHSSATPYTVNITQAAQQAEVTGSTALAGQVVIDSSNDTLALTVDGQATSVTLADGTYNPQALAQAVEGAINGSSDLTSRHVAVAVQGGALTITSNSYGSNSQVLIGNGSANLALGFAGGEAGQGTDVAGNFVVNGVTEAATGTGQFLVGASANANTADLQVRVTLTPAQVGSGTQASLTVSRGFASQLDVVLNRLLDPVNGRLKTIDDSFNTTLSDYKNEVTADTTLMQAKQQQLQTEFANMEQTLAKLQSVSSFISAQALALPQTSSSSQSSNA